MAKVKKVEEISVDLLRPYGRNAKIHTQEQVEKIAESIKEFGFLSPCLIDGDYNIIAGHGRVESAKLLGLKKVPCVFIEGLTEEQRRAYILADNKLTEMGEWDAEIVSEELEALKDNGFNIEVTGFDVDDILFSDEEEYQYEYEDTDPNEETPPRIKKGEVWILGNHRLMCGDSSSKEDVEKLTKGEVVDLLEIDPPYNVAVSNAKGETIENDNLEEQEFHDFLISCFSNAESNMKEGASFYVWHPDSNGRLFINALEEVGLSIKQNLIWVKNHFTIGRQDYQWKHEPCLYGWKEGAGHYFIDMRSLCTVYEEEELKKLDEKELRKIILDYQEELTTVNHEAKPNVDDLHPTMKPLNLIKKHIRNSSRPKEIVLDLFGGSGTTLIACEELDRKCWMMEYDPKYAERIIARWEQHTGRKAEKEKE